MTFVTLTPSCFCGCSVTVCETCASIRSSLFLRNNEPQNHEPPDLSFVVQRSHL
jgi:hypothetical protein